MGYTLVVVDVAVAEHEAVCKWTIVRMRDMQCVCDIRDIRTYNTIIRML